MQKLSPVSKLLYTIAVIVANKHIACKKRHFCKEEDF